MAYPPYLTICLPMQLPDNAAQRPQGRSAQAQTVRLHDRSQGASRVPRVRRQAASGLLQTRANRGSKDD
jgi:hypothetical protein